MLEFLFVFYNQPLTNLTKDYLFTSISHMFPMHVCKQGYKMIFIRLFSERILW